MKIKSPVKKLKGKPIIITLPFGDKTFVNTYKALGWNLLGHNGIDMVCDYPGIKTYGIPIIASHEGQVIGTTFDNPMSRKGNGVVLASLPFIGQDGKKRMIRTIYWHLAEVNCKTGDWVVQGQEIGTMGNTGMIASQVGSLIAPISGEDLSKPYRGTHLHFAIVPFIEENGAFKPEFPNNGYSNFIDPLNYLELDWKKTAPEIEKIPEEERLYPLEWALSIIKQRISEITEKIKSLFK